MDAWLAIAAVFFRGLGLVVTAPALGSRAVPALFKVTLALSMGVLLGPVIPGVSPAAATPPGTGGGVAPASSVVALGWMALGELLVGAAMGFVAGLVLLQAQFAGYLIDLEM
ncbi:MAG: flagellar biosynthetic protein FliR, partial [Thermoleophilia bacterium]|nr:flagellar biosynthetic protein FliR [Thermoleophilia bacterium]